MNIALMIASAALILSVIGVMAQKKKEATGHAEQEGTGAGDDLAPK